MRHALLLVLSVTACTSFDNLDRNVCGNGVIELGEDCDSSASSCVRCAVTCEKATDCPTAAYACGTDGLCHAPGGTLAPPASAGPFQVNEFRITDVGGDGAGDVVGLSRTSIVVRDGDPSGVLSTGLSLVTPFQTGRPAFGDVDDDGSLDITLTTPDGFVTYASPLGELTPLPVSSAVGEGGSGAYELIGLYRISNEALGAFMSAPDGSVLLSVFDLADSTFDDVIAPCNVSFKASAFGETSFDVNRLTLATAASAELLLSIIGPTVGGATKTCVLAIKKSRNLKPAITDVTPANAVNLVGRPVLTDLDFDADPCPGFLATTTGGVLRYWDGARSGLNCTLAASPSVVTLPGLTPGATLVGHFPLTPGIPLVANDVVVMSDGVYANFLGTFGKVYASTRKIARAVTGDINGDGSIDGVVASEGEDDIDILYRTPDAAYQLLRIDTASRITSLTIGDYDGNGIEDIAYTELIDAYQRLEVAFSTPDRPLAPVSMGAFPNNISIIQFSIGDTVDQGSLATDLAVLTLKTGTRPPAVTLFHGSPQRTMIPYYDPIPDGTLLMPKTHQLRGAVVGRFDGDALFDLAGIGANIDSSANSPVRAWLLRGTQLGPDGTPSDGKPISGMTTCPKMSQELCVDDTLYLAIAGTNHDLVLAIDKSDPPRAGIVDPATGASLTVAPVAALTAGVPTGSVVRSAYTLDLEGDGTTELLASFAPRPDTGGPGAIRLCTLVAGTPTACEDLTTQILDKVDGASACFDAAPGRLAFRDAFSVEAPGTDLVVLCRGGGSSMLERVTKTATGLDVTELSRIPDLLDALRVGDVTGDGVDDVAAIAVDHGSESLQVFRQCSSRDASVCSRGGQ